MSNTLPITDDIREEVLKAKKEGLMRLTGGRL